MGTAEETARMKRVYGRGYHDALQQVKDQMNAQRLEELTKGLTGVARKVMDWVPIQEAWHVDRICAESAKSGSRIDKRVLSGCLESLQSQGLVKEGPPRHYARVAAKPKLMAVETAPAEVAEPAKAEEPEKAEEPAAKKDPLDRLLESAQQARALAAEIEEVALEIEDRIRRIHADSAKLRQLQELLRGMND